MSLGLFGKLPAEIRFLVLEYAYANPHVEIAVSSTGALSPAPFSPCRQLRADSLEIIFTKATFLVSSPSALSALNSFLSNNGPSDFAGAEIRLVLLDALLDMPFWDDEHEAYTHTPRQLVALEAQGQVFEKPSRRSPPPAAWADESAATAATNRHFRNFVHKRADVFELFHDWRAAFRGVALCIRALHIDLALAVSSDDDVHSYAHDLIRLAQFLSTKLSMRTKGRSVCRVSGRNSTRLFEGVRSSVVGLRK